MKKIASILVIIIAFGLNNQVSAQDSLAVNANNANVDSVQLLKMINQEILVKNETLTKTIESKMLDRNPASKERFNKIFPKDSVIIADTNKTVKNPVVVAKKVVKNNPATSVKLTNYPKKGEVLLVQETIVNEKGAKVVKKTVIYRHSDAAKYKSRIPAGWVGREVPR
jgi:hypothetical protein